MKFKLTLFAIDIFTNLQNLMTEINEFPFELGALILNLLILIEKHIL